MHDQHRSGKDVRHSQSFGDHAFNCNRDSCIDDVDEKLRLEDSCSDVTTTKRTESEINTKLVG